MNGDDENLRKHAVCVRVERMVCGGRFFLRLPGRVDFVECRLRCDAVSSIMKVTLLRVVQIFELLTGQHPFDTVMITKDMLIN